MFPFSPTISTSRFDAVPHRNFVLPRLHFPSTFWAFPVCQFFISCTDRTPHQFHLLTPTIILTGLFWQTWTFSCGFSVSATVSKALIYAGVTHGLSTFPLRVRDVRLSPITPSTFLQAFAPAVFLTPRLYSILHWENATSYREFINYNTQRYMLWSYWLNANATSSMLRRDV